MTRPDASSENAITEPETGGVTQTQTQTQKTSYRREDELPLFVREALDCLDTNDLPRGVWTYGLTAARLLALAREMHAMNHAHGRIGFYLTARDAAKVGFKSHMRAWRFLRFYFVREGWIEVLASGDQILANCYAYVANQQKGPPYG